MNNVLVTGANGFLGCSLTKHLRQKNFVVGLGFDRHKYEADVDELVYGDIRDEHCLNRILVDYNITEIYHLAAQSIVKTCSLDPYSAFEITVMGTVSLLEACRKCHPQIKSIVISTSDKVYGAAPVPYTEKTTLMPKHIYETSKACQDFIGLSYFHNYDLPVKIVRCSNLYGPGDRNLSRIIPNTILSLLQNKAPILYKGVGEYQREFVFVEDACRAFELVSTCGLPGEAYCAGGTGVWYIKDLVQRITSLMSSDLKPVILTKASSFREIPLQYIDATKLYTLGWKATTSLDDGLQQTIQYYRGLKKENR